MMAANLLQFHFCYVYVINIFLACIFVLSFTAVPSVIVLRTRPERSWAWKAEEDSFTQNSLTMTARFYEARSSELNNFMKERGIVHCVQVAKERIKIIAVSKVLVQPCTAMQVHRHGKRQLTQESVGKLEAS